jgi:hypothetical protein
VTVFWSATANKFKKMSVSAATSVQETLPLEEVIPCNFLVVYEDAATHDLAMKVCDGVTAGFKGELPFAFSFWKLNDLSQPVSAHWATEAVTRADIMLFSLSGRDLTPETSQWLDTCVLARTKAEGALALVVTEPQDAGPAVGALLSRLQFVAHRLRMDFLPLLPALTARNIGTAAVRLPARLNESWEEPGSNHWGLNE